MYVIKPKDGQKQEKWILKKFNNNKYGDDKIKSPIRETLGECLLSQSTLIGAKTGQ